MKIEKFVASFLKISPYPMKNSVESFIVICIRKFH